MSVDPLIRELFMHRFENLVTEMGTMLERTARSTNVKERLDFSCALLNEAGELVVNAPHIPVHLGSLGLCVREVRAWCDMLPGDVVVTNHPAFGGSHLPDVTVITPVHGADSNLIGYVASRAHHAEIGGICPGSMPPNARSLREEGVVIEPAYLIRSGRPRWNALAKRLREPPYPSRAVDDNLADLRAAVAANHHGAMALRRLAHGHGVSVVTRMMHALTDLAEVYMRDALAARQDGAYASVERLDDGSALAVNVQIDGDRAAVDFEGSADVHAGSLNATPAVVRSVILYVLRLMIDKPLPLNEGLLRPVDIRIPRGILSPDFGSAEAPGVVGGNVETSQRLANALIRALGLAACSQGTMNNVLFGDDHLGYYETIGGGCGAGPEFDGASAIHSHMTNTRLTDPEVMEHRYPVRIERHAIRRGSGGQGRYRGGDGIVRAIRFLRTMRVSILSQHRVTGPCGAFGGRAGFPGCQRIERASGKVEPLRSIDGADAASGDLLVVETPGGGGWGSPSCP
ncbi:MAG: hydantoinase B/oxoprolinase family protein [Myxococcota bacterium]